MATASIFYYAVGGFVLAAAVWLLGWYTRQVAAWFGEAESGGRD